ncbi:MAG: GNAT family N-acetyltransferase [Lachnospiraceae bacterium]
MIRKAKFSDIEQIDQIYENARAFMIKSGNPSQWKDGYPSLDLIKKDIEEGVSYVYETEEGIEAVFVFFIGEDPTYDQIENGAWINNLSYGVIHRIASFGRKKGIANKCIDWCYEKHANIRIDTHKDNKVMQHILEGKGFQVCGTIYVRDGSKRIAYQKCEQNKKL